MEGRSLVSECLEIIVFKSSVWSRISECFNALIPQSPVVAFTVGCFVMDNCTRDPSYHFRQSGRDEQRVCGYVIYVVLCRCSIRICCLSRCCHSWCTISHRQTYVSSPGYVCLSLSMSLSLSVCLSVFLSVSVCVVWSLVFC